MKKIFIFAAAAAMFAACSSDDLAVKENQPQAQLEPGAIGFDVYAQKATTRAGWTGSIANTSVLQADDKANGFGVFAYYTDNNEYEQRSVPNFMYNQHVTWDDINQYWAYAPVMYWPNEYGKNAESDDQDKVSFFAYAPYVDVIPTSGKLASTVPAPGDNTKDLEAYGITGMTRNSNQGDPILKYIASFNTGKSVDLCWGVAPEGVWKTTQTGVNMSFDAGLPWLNVQRPAEAATQQAANQRVKFLFKHATAQMKITIDADVDVDGHGHANDVADKTRVWVRQVTFKGFAMKGSLNLNNDAPNKEKWLDYNGQNELVAEDVTVYDGRKDGKEGVNGAIATNEKVTGLNSKIIQAGLYVGDTWDGIDEKDQTVYNAKTIKLDPNNAPGVTKTAENLFESSGDIFHVIPVDNEAFEIEIVYDIETVDGNLAQNLSDGATKGSSIENRITKSIKFGEEECLKAGHSYTLNLHLGMNSVKFDAAVSEWITETPQDVDLPLNVPAYTAENPIPATATDVMLPYTGNYSFAMIGLNGGESVSKDPSAAFAVTPQTTTWSVTNENANASGTAIQTVNTQVNPTTVDREQTVTWTGNQSGKGVKLNFIQKAHPLFMQITKFDNSGTDGRGVITLTRFNNEKHEASTDWTTDGTSAFTTGWFCDGNGTALTANTGEAIKVWRNGVKLTWSAATGDPGAGSNYTFGDDGVASTHTAQINIGDALQPGDVIKVELTTGDAPTETVTATVGGIAYIPASRTITYFNGDKHYDYLPTYSGVRNFSDLTISYGSDDTDIALVENTTVSDKGKISTLKTGEVTITATLSAGGLDPECMTTLKLKIIEQDSKITIENKTVNKITSVGGELNDWSGVKPVGADDNQETGATMSYEIIEVKKNDITQDTHSFTITPDGKLSTSTTIDPPATTGTDTYAITIKVTAPAVANMYNKAEKVITYTMNMVKS
jgi:predicted RecA/RadA family phage recombinase